MRFYFPEIIRHITIFGDNFSFKDVVLIRYGATEYFRCKSSDDLLRCAQFINSNISVDANIPKSQNWSDDDE